MWSSALRAGATMARASRSDHASVANQTVGSSSPQQASGAAYNEATNIAFGLSRTMAIVLWIPLVIGLLVLAMVLVTIRLWIARRGSIWARIGYSIVTLALAVFIVQMYSWNVTSVQNYRFL